MTQIGQINADYYIENKLSAVICMIRVICVPYRDHILYNVVYIPYAVLHKHLMQRYINTLYNVV